MDNRTIRLSDAIEALGKKRYFGKPYTDHEVSYNTAIEDSIAALSALPAVDGWLPIESAPKDGTRVLLYDKFNREQAFARFVGAFGDYGWSSIPGAYGKNPTHWQPLPAHRLNEG